LSAQNQLIGKAMSEAMISNLANWLLKRAMICRVEATQGF